MNSSGQAAYNAGLEAAAKYVECRSESPLIARDATAKAIRALIVEAPPPAVSAEKCPNCGSTHPSAQLEVYGGRSCDHPWHDSAAVSAAPTDKRPPMPTTFQWCSICSAHREYSVDCNRCNTGRWINDELRELDHWLYECDPKLWRKWANRETQPGQPGHIARHFLESVFPGLRKTPETSLSAAPEETKK